MRATDRLMMQDRRRMRAMALTAAAVDAIKPYIDRDYDRNPKALQRASEALFDLFMMKGVEIITDQERAEAGLLPRNELGLTFEELVAIERRRIEVMLQPITMTIPLNNA